MFSTGNQTVDVIGTMNFSGNVIPSSWYRTITKDNGKAYLLAIIILADIVYWYRPVEDRDEDTGLTIGFRKKFRADLLQRSYADIAEQVGEEKQVVRRAVRKLEELGVIHTVLRTVSVNGKLANNVMFIDLDSDKLYELTYPNMAKHDTPIIKNDNRLLSNLTTGCYQKQQQAIINFDNTNTKNTTETSTEISSSSSSEVSNELLEAAKRKRKKEKEEWKKLRDRYGDGIYYSVIHVMLRECDEGKCDSTDIKLAEFLCETLQKNGSQVKVRSSYIRRCIENYMDSGGVVAIEKKKTNGFTMASESYADLDDLEKNILKNG